MSAATAVRGSVTPAITDVLMRNANNSGTRSSSPPASPSAQTASRTSRGCCFCCLAVKSNNGGAVKSRDGKLTKQEKEEPSSRFHRISDMIRKSLTSEKLPLFLEYRPTYEELKMWGESFEKLMKCPGGQRLFREFLRSEYSEENMLFYQACEDLKKEENPDLVEEKARLIYEDYISILSPKEVSLDSRVREVINRNMIEPTPHTFDEAQLQIWTLMHRDSYPRFLNSQLYKKLLQQTS